MVHMVYCEWFREEGIISTMKDVLKECQKSGVSASALPNSTVIYFEVRMSKMNGTHLFFLWQLVWT